MTRSFIIFALLVGLALAETGKQDLLKRLEIAQHQLEIASHQFTSRGFDYFAEVIDTFNRNVSITYAHVVKLPDNVTDEVLAPWVKQVKEIETEIPGKIRFPAGRELFKTGALYLASIKTETHNTSAPTSDLLKKQVYDIIVEENHIKTLNRFPEDQRNHERAEINLSDMYDAMIKNLKDSKVPSPEDFNKLEIEANKKIEEFNKEGKTEQAVMIHGALDKLLNATFHIGKIFPVDSVTRYNQFLKAAPSHYQDYRILNALVFLAKIDL